MRAEESDCEYVPGAKDDSVDQARGCRAAGRRRRAALTRRAAPRAAGRVLGARHRGRGGVSSAGRRRVAKLQLHQHPGEPRRAAPRRAAPPARVRDATARAVTRLAAAVVARSRAAGAVAAVRPSRCAKWSHCCVVPAHRVPRCGRGVRALVTAPSGRVRGLPSTPPVCAVNAAVWADKGVLPLAWRAAPQRCALARLSHRACRRTDYGLSTSDADSELAAELAVRARRSAAAAKPAACCAAAALAACADAARARRRTARTPPRRCTWTATAPATARAPSTPSGRARCAFLATSATWNAPRARRRWPRCWTARRCRATWRSCSPCGAWRAAPRCRGGALCGHAR
jgi:hypothetical protein